MVDEPSESCFQRLGSLGSTALVAVADAATIRFQRIGVALPPGNRLERARALLQQSQGGGPLVVKAGDMATAKLVAEATRDAFDFYFISRPLGWRSQTALFGDGTRKPGDVDIILRR